MKTPEAIETVKRWIAEHRATEKHYTAKANRPHVQDAELRRRYLKFADREKRAAKALEILLGQVESLASLLDRTADAADYVNGAPLAGIELTREDRAVLKSRITAARNFLRRHKLAKKWKVQFLGLNGWWDLKATEDGKTYVVCVYDSIKEARDDVRDINRGTKGPRERHRVTTLETPEDWSPY